MTVHQLTRHQSAPNPHAPSILGAAFHTAWCDLVVEARHGSPPWHREKQINILTGRMRALASRIVNRSVDEPGHLCDLALVAAAQGGTSDAVASLIAGALRLGGIKDLPGE